MRSLSVQTEPETKPWVLLVDDEAFNLEILDELLGDYGYQTDTAENGREACEMLTANPDKYAVVLLDRMMPEMDGMEVTKFINQHPRLRKIPIVMQSAKAAKQDIEKGLNAGVLYYLTKPFGKNELLSIVDNAAQYFADYQVLLEDLGNHQHSSELPESAELNTIEDARRYALSHSLLASDPEKVVMGLYELLINAIEHGNLGIGYKLKSSLNNTAGWMEEVENRMRLSENENKKVKVSYQIDEGDLIFKIPDEGAGFNYKDFLEISTSRSLNMTGRGIAVAKVLCFDSLEFVDPGNQVIVKTQVAKDLY